MRIRLFKLLDSDAVLRLWERCQLLVPWNDPRVDIEKKMAFQADLFFVGEVDKIIVASAMAGYEGHRGWINYLAVEPSLQRSGLGREMMNHCEQVLENLGCQKINLQIRSGNLAVLRFYENLGFKRDDCIAMGKRLQRESLANKRDNNQ